jgi:hypothetical protein
MASAPTEELPPVVLATAAPVTEEIDVVPFVPYANGNGHANGNGNGHDHGSAHDYEAGAYYGIGHVYGLGTPHDFEAPFFGEESVSFVNAPFHGPMSVNSSEPSPTASLHIDAEGDTDGEAAPRWHLPLHDDDDDEMLQAEWIGPLVARNGDAAGEPEPEPAGGPR